MNRSRRTILLPILLLMTAPLQAAAGLMTDAASPTACLYELSGLDHQDHTVLQTVAASLDSPGLLIAPLHRLEGAEWTRLQARADSARPGIAAPDTIYDVPELVEVEPSSNIALLRVPGIVACERPPHGDGELTTGARLIGIRERAGYRPRLFRARIERQVVIPGEPRLFMVEIPDGGGAEAGFILDTANRLVGVLSPPEGDGSLAYAVETLSRLASDAATTSRRPVREALPRRSEPAFLDSPGGLFARANLLSREDQPARAVGVLDEIARRHGEFEGLLLERGAAYFKGGRIQEAIGQFTTAAQLDPSLHLAHYNLGIALGASARYAEAAEALARAAEVDPSHPRTHYQLALALLAADRSEEARKEQKLLTGLDPLLASDLASLLPPENGRQ